MRSSSFLFIGHNKKRLRGVTREIKWPVIGIIKKASFILHARGNIVFFTLWLGLLCTVRRVFAGGFLLRAKTGYFCRTKPRLSCGLPALIKAFHSQKAALRLQHLPFGGRFKTFGIWGVCQCFHWYKPSNVQLPFVLVYPDDLNDFWFLYSRYLDFKQTYSCVALPHSSSVRSAWCL